MIDGATGTVPAARRREGAIETLRGLAAILIVAYHCIPKESLELEGSFSYAYLGHTFRLIRLPLFTAISGYVYAMRPLDTAQVAVFLKGKARRILLPWFSTTLLTIGLGYFISGSGERLPLQDSWRPFVFSYGHLWFLQAIFWIFLLLVVLERCGALATPKSWFLVLGLSGLVSVFLMDTIEVFGVRISDRFLSRNGFAAILPFFLFGLGLRRFGDLMSRPPVVGACAVVAAIGLTIHQLTWWKVLTLTQYTYNLLVVCTACAAQGVLFRLRREWPPLARLGAFAFPIYLFHILAISVAVRALRLLHVENAHALFASKLVLGVALPVLASMLLTRIPPLRLLFLGERTKPQSAPMPA